MSKTEVKKYIKELGADSLRQMILDLYSYSSEAKEFLDYHANPDDQKMAAKCIEVIDREFRPSYHYRRLTFGKSKKAISNLKKLDPHPGILADVMIYMLTSAVETAGIWGNVEESFANSLGNNYKAIIEFLAKQGLLDEYKRAMTELAHDVDSFGYGVGFGVYDLYEKHYGVRP